jgi:hypothetical protein
LTKVKILLKEKKPSLDEGLLLLKNGLLILTREIKILKKQTKKI